MSDSCLTINDRFWISKRFFISISTHIGIFQLEKVNIRLTAVEQEMSLLYERQSTETLIKLLNDSYLIDIRQLDTQILSSFLSKEMH